MQTQAERGARYDDFLPNNMAWPMMVGMHWFEFSDQSPQGRFDGENSNYGIVDIEHRPYTELIRGMIRGNAAAIAEHRVSELRAPDALPEPSQVVVNPGQYPDRPPRLSFLSSPSLPFEAFAASDASLLIGPAVSGGLQLTYDSGHDWGAGMTFVAPSPVATPSPDGAGMVADLDGYDTLVVEATAPEGLKFNVIFEEAGAAAPGSQSYGRAGDDGESFLWETQLGTGEATIYRLPLANLQPRTNWGNQDGKRVVDLKAMRGPIVMITPGQGEGTIAIHDVRLER
ncbi:MAG: hypothetical protein RLY93_01620 [Sumerlaeia bacterium]